jgi:hypothetical protein
MTALDLPALDGRKPLGFFAAIGLTRLLTVSEADAPEPPRLSWRLVERSAVLHSRHDSLDAVVDALARVVAAIPADAVLPGGPPGLPPPCTAPDKLRVPPAQLRELASSLSVRTNPEAEAWLASLITDLCLDDKGRADISLMAAPSGGQSMFTMLDKPLALVRGHPEYLREALVGWRRLPGVSGEYLDHQVLYDAADSGDGESDERGVPGATWLAIMAYPLLRTTSAGADPTTTGWHRRNGRQELVFPLWSQPLDTYAIVALLEHPLWATALNGKMPAEARALSVFDVNRARRRRIPGRNFAGVLGPTR